MGLTQREILANGIRLGEFAEEIIAARRDDGQIDRDELRKLARKGLRLFSLLVLDVLD